MKKILSIVVLSIMVTTIFGAMAIPAQECVLLSGTVEGKFENVWCEEELETYTLSNVCILIEKIDDGEVVATTETVTDINGFYQQEVLKGSRKDPKTYRVTIGTSTDEIYGEEYVFPGESKTVTVKGNSVILDFTPMGTIRESKTSSSNNLFIYEILNNFICRIFDNSPFLLNLLKI